MYVLLKMVHIFLLKKLKLHKSLSRKYFFITLLTCLKNIRNNFKIYKNQKDEFI